MISVDVLSVPFQRTFGDRTRTMKSKSRVRFSTTPEIYHYDRAHSLRITRSKTEPAMVATSVLRTVRVTEPNLRISVDDILVYAERERQCHSARGRRQALENAQSSTYKIEDVVRSRPHTSASRYLTSVRRETMTPKSIRSEPMPSRVSSRMDDYNDFEEEENYPINLMSSPAPVCCEIIGPQACNECLKNHRRRQDLEQSEARFPSLTISDQNLTTATMLQRYFPSHSIEQIHMKLVRGEIARPKLPHEKFDREPPNKKAPPMSSRMRQNVTKLTSSLFFVNIRDLNHRITSGKVSRTVGFSHKPVARRNFIETSSGFPAFISPRKQGNLKEQKPNDRRSFPFDPPLLAKRNQRPEPPFFAGSDQPYKLPQKLPDKIEFVENGVTKRSVSVLSEAASDISVTEDTKTGSVSEVKDEHAAKKNTSISSDILHEGTLKEERDEDAVFEETNVQIDKEQIPVHTDKIEEDDTLEHTEEDNTGVYTEEDNTGMYTEEDNTGMYTEVADSEERSDAKTPTPSLEDEEDDAIIDSQMFESELDW